MTPFVYQFLGEFNQFHGRVDGGLATVGDWTVPVPAGAKLGDDAALIYVRPHDVEILREKTSGALKAVVKDFFALGPRVRVELKRADNGETIQADLGKDRFLDLHIGVGDEVYVRPRRHRLFSAA